jgi:hypothetical protein
MNEWILFIQDAGIWSMPIIAGNMLCMLCFALWTLLVVIRKGSSPLLVSVPVSVLFLVVLAGSMSGMSEVVDAANIAPPSYVDKMMAGGISKCLSLKIFLLPLAFAALLTVASCALHGIKQKSKNLKRVIPWVLVWVLCGFCALLALFVPGDVTVFGLIGGRVPGSAPAVWGILCSGMLLLLCPAMIGSDEDGAGTMEGFVAALLAAVVTVSLLTYSSSWQYLEMLDALAYAPPDVKMRLMVDGVIYHSERRLYLLPVPFLAFLPSLVAVLGLGKGKLQAWISLVVVFLLSVLIIFLPSLGEVDRLIQPILEQLELNR